MDVKVRPATVRSIGDWRSLVPYAVAALLMLPLFVVVVRSLANGWQSHAGDVSLIELRTRDVGTTHTPLLGSYGRYGFNHPGPLWFGALALPYRLTGNLEVGVVLVGLASLAAVVWVAVRRGGLWWTALLTAILVWGAGPAYVSNPWEPEGLLLPSAALVLLAFDAAAGSDWSLPLVVGFASLLGAAQATLLPFAVAMVVVAAVRVRSKGPLLVAGAVLVVSWLPTVIQQLFVDPPNLTAMWNARARTEPALGLRGAWDTVAVELAHNAPWLGFDTALDGLNPIVDLRAAPLVPLGLVALVAALCWKRHILGVVAVVAIGAAIIAMSQLLGPVYVWIPGWLRVIGFACWLAAGWVVADRIPKPILAAGFALVVALAVWDAATFDREEDYMGEAIRSLAKQIDVPDDPVLVSSDASGDLLFAGDGIGVETLALALEKRGIETVVDASAADRFGPRRAQPDRAEATVRLVSVAEGGIDPLPRTLREERNELMRRLGLRPDATIADIFQVAVENPDLHDIADRARRIPNLPRIDIEVETTD